MLVEDMGTFFSDFAQTARFTLGGEEKTVRVIFEQPYQSAFDGVYDASSPACTGPSRELAGLQRGSAITVGDTHWRITRAQPDGTGLTRLLLETA